MKRLGLWKEMVETIGIKILISIAHGLIGVAFHTWAMEMDNELKPFKRFKNE